MPSEFWGASSAMSSAGLESAAGLLNVREPEIWTILTVETCGCGFLASRRPQMLYERHYFSELTKRAYDDGDISSPQPGGYGETGESQYDRLARAVELDRGAALQSCSWGLGQVMGMNYRMAGFGSPEEMVAAMCGAEDAQLLAFARFLKSARLDAALRAHDWTALARGYNGPGYAKNAYDTNLSAAWVKYGGGQAPDLRTRAAQLYLTFAGFDPGPVDGTAGARTRAALLLFQERHGLLATGLADDATLQALEPRAPVPA